MFPIFVYLDDVTLYLFTLTMSPIFVYLDDVNYLCVPWWCHPVFVYLENVTYLCVPWWCHLSLCTLMMSPCLWRIDTRVSVYLHDATFLFTLTTFTLMVLPVFVYLDDITSLCLPWWHHLSLLPWQHHLSLFTLLTSPVFVYLDDITSLCLPWWHHLSKEFAVRKFYLCSKYTTSLLLYAVGLLLYTRYTVVGYGKCVVAIYNRCIQLSENCAQFMTGDNMYTASAWDWLTTNELIPCSVTKETG